MESDKCYLLWKIYMKCKTYKYKINCMKEFSEFSKCRNKTLINYTSIDRIHSTETKSTI